MKVLVLGNGLSGRCLCDYFYKNNIDYICLSHEDIIKNYTDKNEIDRFLFNIDLCIISPGINLNNELVFQIKKRKIAFFGELEFASRLIKNRLIAVTGTNGKTTVVSLIYHILKDYKYGCVLCGNIGTPLTSYIEELNKEDSKISVIECSSFQLETTINFKPKIAVILNITEDHLNRHCTMDEYIRCKYKITKNQSNRDYLLLNYDDEYLKNNPPKTKAKILYFSLKQKVVGCYLKNKYIYFFDGICEIKLVSVSRIKLVGNHNLSNILVSVLSVFLITKNINILNNIESFLGVEHRIEYVDTINGIKFYNDSKATNIASTLVAIKAFKNNLFLILGGSDKGYDFDELIRKLSKNVKYIAIFGETKNKIAFSIKKHNFNNYIICDDLSSAVKQLFSIAKPGDTILLSPACASFDFFKNYEERGKFFKSIVKEIKNNENNDT